ncbi:hypothetical protein ABN220_06490 [Proteus cibi]|uniref:hypothetical protein n=1 Tax=Proteus cibi TaxID=2050966 RepID=UPI0032DB9CBB
MVNQIDGNVPISYSNGTHEINESSKFSKINNSINDANNTNIKCKKIFNMIELGKINKVLMSKIKTVTIEKNIDGKYTTRLINKKNIIPSKPNENITQSVSDDLKQIQQAVYDNADAFVKLMVNNKTDSNENSFLSDILSNYNNFTSLAPEFHNKSSKAMTDFSISLELKNADEAIILSILENNTKDHSVYYVKQYLEQKYKKHTDAREQGLHLTKSVENILKIMDSNKLDKKIENLFELVNDFKNKKIARNKSDLNTRDIFKGVANLYLQDTRDIKDIKISVNLEQAKSIIKDKKLTFAASLSSEEKLNQVNLAIDETLKKMEIYQSIKNEIINLVLGKVKSVNRSNVFIRGMKGIRNVVIGKDNSKNDRLNKLTEGLINSFESNTLRILEANIKKMEKITKNIEKSINEINDTNETQVKDNDINYDEDKVKNEN